MGRVLEILRVNGRLGAAVFALMVLTSCGGGGGGTSSSTGSAAATIAARPVLSANSSDFSAGTLDDDPASPTSARNVSSATAILPSINATPRIAAASTIATWSVDDIILGKPAPAPSSKVAISVAAFKIEDARKDIVSGDGGFANANCTEYAFERRNQLVSFLRSNGIGGVRDTLINTDIRKSSEAVRAKLGLNPSGAAMYWLEAYRAAGYKTGGVPAPGALAVYGPQPGVLHSVGHVAVVEKVWYDTSTRKIVGWYLSERNIELNGQLRQTCNGVCLPSRPNYAGFMTRPDQPLNRNNLLGFVYLLPDDISSFSSDSVALTPQQLRADRTGTNRVNLTWQGSGNTQGVDTFVVYRDGTEVARTPSSPWVDANAAAIGPVCYQVATKVNNAVSDQAGLSAKTPLACAAGAGAVQALTAPALTGICQGGLASLTWASAWNADSISIVKNNETIKVLSAGSNAYSTTAPTNSRFTIQFRRGIELVESNVVSLSCSAPSPQTGTIAASTTPGTVDFGEQMVESNSRLSWVATYLQTGANLLVRGRNLEDNSVLWQQTLPVTGFASALVDSNGFVLLTYDGSGNVNLQTNSLNADTTISKVTTQVTQIANSLGTAAINKSLLANQLAQPWKVAKSSDRALIAVYSGTSVASDGTAPIWIFDIASGVPVLTKTIRLSGTFVMGLSIVNSDVFILGGDGIARRYAIAGSGGLKSSIALQNPAFDLGSFTCFAEQCLAKANSTGILEVVDFSLNTSRFVSLGAYFVGRFKVAGGLIVATLNDSFGCKFGLFRLSDAAQQGALQAMDCKNGNTQLPVLAMSVYDEWTSSAGVMAWTSSFTSGVGVQNGPKTYVYRVGGLQ